ncbi:YciE/YciF family protein [Flavobacterium suaedae]|uniref:YciE/YciF family protein n=1 Tax=Flavobacterium suaedae TaxID=1767027 RepID=A0ABQ1JDG2_9FLAO|nr:ferritin-like domain-containing protein [Flavobacterium suaedae]GGB66033.1 YciE/YciF family protein [Flavobacterium suaedae]
MATETKSKATNKEVKTSSGAAKDLKSLYIDSLKDIYWAENALLKKLPKIAKNATTESLKKAIEDHTKETEGHIERLEKAFELIGEKASGEKCEAMDGLLKEGEDIMESTKPGAVRDAGIIAASQKIEHYEIATYGTICAFAKTLGQDEAAKLLHETLKEEKAADQTLTDTAYNDINFEADKNK